MKIPRDYDWNCNREKFHFDDFFSINDYLNKKEWAINDRRDKNSDTYSIQQTNYEFEYSCSDRGHDEED